MWENDLDALASDWGEEEAKPFHEDIKIFESINEDVWN
jgi:hypothetical protein